MPVKVMERNPSLLWAVIILAVMSCYVILVMSLGNLLFPDQDTNGVFLLPLAILTVGMMGLPGIVSVVKWLMSSPVQHYNPGKRLIIPLLLANGVVIGLTAFSTLYWFIGCMHMIFTVVAVWYFPKWDLQFLSVVCANCEMPIALYPFKWFMVLSFTRHARLYCPFCGGRRQI